MHRDIKPANILLFRNEQGRLQAKLSDFGLAKLCESSSPKNTRNLCTLHYRAPEVLLGSRDYSFPSGHVGDGNGLR